jgi:hypothetical protein
MSWVDLKNCLYYNLRIFQKAEGMLLGNNLANGYSRGSQILLFVCVDIITDDIWGFRVSDYDECRLLGCEVEWFLYESRNPELHGITSQKMVFFKSSFDNSSKIQVVLVYATFIETGRSNHFTVPGKYRSRCSLMLIWFHMNYISWIWGS